MVATGKVIRFDEVRGYGFIAPDAGGEDVFMHVNDLLEDKHRFSPGTTVQFTLGEGERGRKASGVSLMDSVANLLPRPPVASGSSTGSEAEDGLCDVLSTREFSQEMTEALLHAVPTISAAQLLQVRDSVVKLAHTHGWVDR